MVYRSTYSTWYVFNIVLVHFFGVQPLWDNLNVIQRSCFCFQLLTHCNLQYKQQKPIGPPDPLGWFGNKLTLNCFISWIISKVWNIHILHIINDTTDKYNNSAGMESQNYWSVKKWRFLSTFLHIAVMRNHYSCIQCY